MTADIRALALKLAADAGSISFTKAPMRAVVGVSLTFDQLEALVRAALAAGLRMGEEVCEEEIMRHGGPFQAQRCAAALRAKADELDSRDET